MVGAFGLHAYGLARATSDLEFVTEAEAQAKVITFLESLGYETLHSSTGYSNHLHLDPSMGRVDLVYIRGETKTELFEAATDRLSLEGMTVPVPKPEHLAAMKVQAMKNDPERTLQEMADIHFLLGLPGVDEDEVKRYFEKQGLVEKFYEIKKLRRNAGPGS